TPPVGNRLAITAVVCGSCCPSQKGATVMASIWKKGEHFYCRMLWYGKRRNIPLGTIGKDAAGEMAGIVGGIIARMKRGEINKPDDVDVVEFIRGRLAALHGEGDAPAIPLPTVAKNTLSVLRDRYIATHSNGTVEENSLDTSRMHLNHFVKH